MEFSLEDMDMLTGNTIQTVDPCIKPQAASDQKREGGLFYRFYCFSAFGENCVRTKISPGFISVLPDGMIVSIPRFTRIIREECVCGIFRQSFVGIRFLMAYYNLTQHEMFSIVKTSRC